MAIGRKKIIRKCKTKEEFSVETTEELLHLLEIYLSEWEHRDTLFWKQIFTYFFSSLVVMLLPFMNAWGLHLPESIPNFIFPAIGLVMSVLFFIVSNGYLARLKAVHDTYQSLIEKLPFGYRENKVERLYPGVQGKILTWRMGAIICGFMFLALVVIGIVLLCCTIN